jgi:carbon starvation protein
LQDVLGNLWRPLGETKRLSANVLASVLVVIGWGYFLIQGVRDPLGGINSLWPLFGIANQMLAAIALCLGTTILLKMQLGTEESKIQRLEPKANRPAFALVTLLPLIWLLSVTMTAGVEKIFHSDPRIGFLAQARVLKEKLPSLERAALAAKANADAGEIELANRDLHNNRLLYFNNVLDAVVAGAFLALVSAIFLLSAREWILLLARRKLSRLRESEPVWLPDYAIAEARPLHLAGLVALALALAKELSGEAQLERAQQAANLSESQAPGIQDLACIQRTPEQIYLEQTEERFKGVRRCC